MANLGRAVGRGARYWPGAGRTRAGGPRPDGATLFRICSLSKVVTGTALARAVLRGEFSLSDSLPHALPGWFDLPANPFDSILLEHVATHSSGLPRGLDIDPDGGIGYFARALARTNPASNPGSKYAYSNLGAQLVGMALTYGTELAFDSVLGSTLVGGPGLSDIVEHPDGQQRSRVASWHDGNGGAARRPPTRSELPQAGSSVRRRRSCGSSRRSGTVPARSSQPRSAWRPRREPAQATVIASGCSGTPARSLTARGSRRSGTTEDCPATGRSLPACQSDGSGWSCSAIPTARSTVSAPDC